jgi:hypothetical protein
MEVLFAEASKVDLIIIGILLLFLISNGIIQVPKWLNIKKAKTLGNYPESHAACELYPEHLSGLKDQRAIGEKVSRIKYHDTVYDQMIKVRLYAEQVKTILMRHYTKLLQDRGLNEKQISDAKIDYRKDLKIAIDEACGYLRKWVKNNHFTDKSDVEFNEYIMLRTAEVMEKVTEVIDAYYLSSVCIIDREELRKSNETECAPGISQLISKMFFEIREIAEIKQKEIAELEKGVV